MGQLITDESDATIVGSGRRLTVHGLDVTDLVLNRVLLISEPGDFDAFDDVEFLNYECTDNYFTFRNPGETDFDITFNNLDFSDDSNCLDGGNYIVLDDTVEGAPVLEVYLLGALPSYGTVTDNSLTIRGAMFRD
jgi:hypothetical protein